ncbi:uncharacterized protein NP_1828A [Natronomonas pharaonis DSM 2160]|uniref:Uncharacterized protein n=1 Tax=Natronomonas pharaonis (strain ATCC 35678 / DSM 2160 / CIP 103997 / JCM 8858 / NBRC 14720 / NCIMB 2260 / Gabara) TaxID=348780 RepID=A0A1U7EVF6_NATPD|nr:hypothetical protein [Natronomonas pharaonis]CAI49005.2 uncharacterized protein NP_1828A [Natronomonas pharaonis DSM 2160]
MGTKETEACGRCGVSSVVDTVEEEGERSATNPFEGERIEIAESEARSVLRHEVFIRKVTARLNRVVLRLTYSR